MLALCKLLSGNCFIKLFHGAFCDNVNCVKDMFFILYERFNRAEMSSIICSI
ncbi:hypothetical protein PSPO_a1914 [Pseudoalteromonas spongiae UST010723-006]|nr:hypothetical protein PSPO_a1914 [Pseudoalteromonas spongiae UST010723-006]